MITEQLIAYLGAPTAGGDYMVLDDSVRGELNGSYELAPDTVGVDLSNYTFAARISRGRQSKLSDDIPPAVASIQLHNHSRDLDPTNGAGAWYGTIKPGRRVDFISDGVTVLSGIVEDWDFDYEVSGRSTATIVATDALGQLGGMEFDAWTATSQRAGQRVAAVLDRGEVGFGPRRSIATGDATLVGDNVSWGSNVLNYLQLVARSENGYLFASRDNVLTFLARSSVGVSSISATFSDEGTGFEYSAITASYGSDTLYNRVSVDREGGTAQTVTDSDSAAEYGIRSLSRDGLLLDSDSQSLALANFLLGKYREPVWRVTSITVDVHRYSDLNDRLALLSLDLGAVVRVIFTPNRVGSPIIADCVIEGRDDEMIPAQHRITFHLSDLDSIAQFVLDNAVYGRLDFGNSLAY